jgi:hypothetical protein
VVAPGPVFAVEGGLDRHVRIPWTASPETLTEAVRRLAAAWEHVSTTTRPTTPGSRDGAGRVMVA